jgi:hypothetical protein
MSLLRPYSDPKHASGAIVPPFISITELGGSIMGGCRAIESVFRVFGGVSFS